MNIAIYVRVSTVEQAKEGYSIGEQTERLTKYAEAHGWHIYKIYTDPGFSGSNMDRPALQELISAVKQKKFEKVLVYKLDRLSRSQKDTLTIIEDILIANNVDFVSMNENFDTSTPFGKAMIGILAVFAQLEREQIKERMAMGKEARAKKGLWNGGSEAPYGYIYKDGLLYVDDFEAMIVRKIYALAGEGKSDRKIAAILKNEGYKTRLGEWQRTSVRGILNKEIYSGIITFKDSKFEGLHDPIIDSDEFNEVQTIKRKRANDISGKGWNPWKAASCISGLVYCAKCGNKYYIRTNRCHKGDKHYMYKKFVCEGRENSNNKSIAFKCNNKNWRKEKLVDLVLNEIRKLAIEPDYLNTITNQTSKSDDKKIINAEIKKLDNQISRLMDLYALEEVPIDTIRDRIAALSEKKKALNEHIQRLNDEKAKNEHIKKIKKSIGKIPTILDKGSEEDIHQVVVELINKIEIDGDDVNIYWNF